MDVLSDVLESVGLDSMVFAHGSLLRPWGIVAHAGDSFPFHIVAHGTCRLEIDGEPPIELSAGDVVVGGRGRSQIIRDHATTPAMPLPDFLATGAFRPRPDERPSTELVCGCFRFDALPDDPLVAALPTVMHARDLGGQIGWLAATIELLGVESTGDHPGGTAVVKRLCDALFVYVLRRFLAEIPIGEPSWLRALVDPRIGPVMRVIHAEPARAWTVAELATKGGMSRSAFAAEFQSVVGEAPMQYLIRWRLRKAAAMLRGTRAGIAEIAAQVGYDSEGAFSKAFKRSIGMSPGAFRRGAAEAA